MTDNIEVDRYVLDTLMRDLVGHDRRPTSYLVYLSILEAGNGKPIALSHQQLADRAGVSKRAAQNALVHLGRRGLVAMSRRAPTEPTLLTPLRPWRR